MGRLIEPVSNNRAKINDRNIPVKRDKQNPAYRFAAAQYALSLIGRGFFVFGSLAHLFIGLLVFAG
jgi:hypothetical protein